MNAAVSWAVVGGVLALAGGAAQGADPMMIRSRSGQFVVRGLAVGPGAASGAMTSRVDWVRLDPAVLAVSLERLKQALLKTAGLEDHWQGTIYVVVHPIRRDQESIRVVSIRTPKGWDYRIEAPEFVRAQRLLRAATQVLLMEIANRGAGERQADLPPWLAEGLLAEMQTTMLESLTLEPQTGMVRHGRRRHPLAGPRECLRTNTPLTFDQLSWPVRGGAGDADARLYRHCAHLFVHELLGLRDGPGRLRDLLRQARDARNWQTAFLRAYARHFPRLLDVDKWWSLAVVDLTGKDPFSLWPVAESHAHLHQILLTHAEVRSSPGELPVATQVTLQQLIADWDPARQWPVLRDKLTQLAAVRPRVVPGVARLVDGYSEALRTYLGDQPAGGPRKSAPVRRVLQRLDALDADRERLWRAAVEGRDEGT
ncbi:MAG: hypothetical protein JXQ71_01760 [Verrucomicrobia bacterium]|nr:hypothetical protein [Verrucomicrobiota bacterium]